MKILLIRNSGFSRIQPHSPEKSQLETILDRFVKPEIPTPKSGERIAILLGKTAHGHFDTAQFFAEALVGSVRLTVQSALQHNTYTPYPPSILGIEEQAHMESLRIMVHGYPLFLILICERNEMADILTSCEIINYTVPTARDLNPHNVEIAIVDTETRAVERNVITYSSENTPPVVRRLKKSKKKRASP